MGETRPGPSARQETPDSPAASSAPVASFPNPAKHNGFQTMFEPGLKFVHHILFGPRAACLIRSHLKMSGSCGQARCAPSTRRQGFHDEIKSRGYSDPRFKIQNAAGSKLDKLQYLQEGSTLTDMLRLRDGCFRHFTRRPHFQLFGARTGEFQARLEALKLHPSNTAVYGPKRRNMPTVFSNMMLKKY